MKKLKEVVDKQRDEIRARDRELTLKSEDVEAVRLSPFTNCVTLRHPEYVIPAKHTAQSFQDSKQHWFQNSV